MSMSNSIFIPELLGGIDESLLAECDEMVAANMWSFARSRRVKLRTAFIAAATLSVIAVSSLLFVLFKEDPTGDPDGSDKTPITKQEEVITPDGRFIIENGALISYTGEETEVVIPDGITRISATAFAQNTNVSTITLGSSVEEIDDGVFEMLKELSEIRTSDYGAIKSINGLVISANGKQIIFVNKNSLAEHLVVPEGVLIIKDGMFKNNSHIKSVKLPSTMQKIGDAAFSYCISLSEVSFGGTRIIADNAFGGCYELSKVDFGMVEEIGKKAFLDCRSLKDISFKNLIKIGTSAFENTGIKSVDLGKRAETVEVKAFQNTYLEEIVIPVTIKYISYDVFTNNNIKCICFRGSKAQWEIVKLRLLMAIDIIEQYEIIFLNESPKIEGTVEIGFKSNKDGTCIAYALDKKNAVGKVTVPSRSPAGDTVVGIEAFDNCSFITEVTLPSTVTSLPNSAFSNCVYLTGIKMPGVISIGSGAFSNCVSLKAVTLNKGIKVIQQNTFSGCCYLTSLTIPEGVRFIRSGAFSGCPIKEMIMPSTLESIESNIFGHYSQMVPRPCYLEKIDLSKTKITELPDDAFVREEALKEVLLPDTLLRIYNGAFQGCTALETIDIPDSVTYIHKRAFLGCTSLKTIIPERNELF